MIGRWRASLIVGMVAIAALVAMMGASAAVAAPEPPRLVTAPAEEVEFTSAKLVGSVNPHGSPTTYYFAWGTSYYSLPNRTPELPAGEGTHSTLFSEVLSGLEDGREYFYQLVATNGGGTSKGSIGHFVTLEDKIPPKFEDGLQLFVNNTAGEDAPEAYFQEAEDPVAPDGSPGSGVAGYEYRYAVSGSAYTAWSVAFAPHLVATGAKAGDHLSVQVRIYDLVGNRSEVYEASQIVPEVEEASQEAEEPEERIFNRTKYVASEASSSQQQDASEGATPLDSSENNIPPEVRKEFHEAFLHGEGCESVGTTPEVRLLNGHPHEVSDVYVKCVPETYLITATLKLDLRKVVPGMAIAPIEKEEFVSVSGPATGEPKGPYRIAYECQSGKATEWLAETHANWFHFNPATKKAWERSTSAGSGFVEDSCN